MNELEPSNKKPRKPSPAREAADLASLTGMLNNAAGVVAPKEKSSPASVALRETAAVVTLEPARSIPTQQTPVSPQAPGAGISKIFLTGRLKVGKDFAAAAAGFKILALADPLRFLLEYFFGSKVDKNSPGARTFLQQIGQIGRGELSSAYPVTIERALFTRTIRETIKDSSLCVNWQDYGRNEDIWLDALVARVKAEPAGARVAVSGVRFTNEFLRLTKEGFQHWHVMASPATWAVRLKAAGLTPESPAVKDLSEQLAASLDANVIKQISTQRGGVKLSCVWSDSKVVPPSGRLLTVGEFCALLGAPK